MEITELMEWLSGGPNFAPFTGLQAPVRSIFAIGLAIAGLAALFYLAKGVVTVVLAGSNTGRRAHGQDDIKWGLIGLAIVFGLGFGLAAVAGALGSIF